MRKYESIVVFAPTLGEARLKEETTKIENLIQAQQGQNLKVDSWGKKEIAYPVEKHKFGHYRCFCFETDNHAIIDVLQGQLRISDSVIKFQTHRLNEKVRKFKGNPRRVRPAEGLGEVADGEFEDEAAS